MQHLDPAVRVEGTAHDHARGFAGSVVGELDHERWQAVHHAYIEAHACTSTFVGLGVEADNLVTTHHWAERGKELAATIADGLDVGGQQCLDRRDILVDEAGQESLKRLTCPCLQRAGGHTACMVVVPHRPACAVMRDFDICLGDAERCCSLVNRV